MSKLKNCIFSICEHFFEIVIVFATFKYIIHILGLQNLGVWSMTNAITSLASVGTSGFASSAVKFVASSFSNKNISKTRFVIGTSFILVFISSLLMTLMIFIGFKFGGHLFLTDTEYNNISKLILFVLILFNISIIARLFQSCLDGMFEIQTRVKINIVSKILYLCIFYVMINLSGLVGVAISMIFQQVFIVVSSLIVIIRKLGLNFTSKIWDNGTFKEIFRYGYFFQLNSLLQMLTDPFTRFMIKSYGSLEILGMFEVIYKVFTQVRMVIIVILNTYLPYLVATQKESLDIKQKEFARFWDLTVYVSTLMLTAIFPLLLFIILILGLEFNNEIYLTASLLYFSLLTNLYSSTIYYDNLASGKIKHNFYSLIVFAITNLTTAFLFGHFWGFYGVLTSWSLSHLFSSMALFYFFSINSPIEIRSIFTKFQVFFLILCIGIVVFLCIVNNFVKPWQSSVLSLFILIIIALKFIPLNYKKYIYKI